MEKNSIILILLFARKMEKHSFRKVLQENGQEL